MDWHSHIISSNYTVDLHTGSDLTPTAGGWGLAYIFKKLFMTKYRVAPALLPLLTGSARRVVHGEIGCSKWKKTLAYLLVLPGSRARIVRCGGRYDPQLVKRSSE